MSNVKKQDLKSIGDIYGGLLNVVKKNIIQEKTKASIGEAPLQKGGPQKEGGFVETELDIKKLSKKNLKDNFYNMKGLNGVDVDNNESEEDEEEITQEMKKSIRYRINNFMRKKSIFDKLYENVMSEEEAEDQDIMELGLSDATPDDELGDEGLEGEDSVTFTLDRETAQKLHDVLMSVLSDDVESGDDFEGEDFGGEEDYEEDEEDGEPTPERSSINYGKNNKVGNLKPSGGTADHRTTSKVGDDGDHGHALHNAKQPNMGKNNKVGKLKQGHGLFQQ